MTQHMEGSARTRTQFISSALPGMIHTLVPLPPSWMEKGWGQLHGNTSVDRSVRQAGLSGRASGCGNGNFFCVTVIVSLLRDIHCWGQHGLQQFLIPGGQQLMH